MFRCCVNNHATTLNCNCTDHTETRRSETFVSTNSLAAGPVACWFLLVLPVFPRRPKKKEKKKNNKKKQKAQVPSVIQCRETMTTQLGHSKATPVGFEPTRGDPIGLAGRRLNHSAKVSFHKPNVSHAHALLIESDHCLSAFRREDAHNETPIQHRHG